MSYFKSTNLNKVRALRIINAEEDKELIMRKFRKVILLDGTHFNFAPDDACGLREGVEKSKLDDYLKASCFARPRAYNGIILDLLKSNNLTPTMIAGVLGLPVRSVESLLQGLTIKVDLRIVNLIAGILSISVGELIDACYLRKQGKFGKFLQCKGIIQEARHLIDEYMQGKRSFWWDELKIYIYQHKNKRIRNK